jgi:hypothetical protein
MYYTNNGWCSHASYRFLWGNFEEAAPVNAKDAIARITNDLTATHSIKVQFRDATSFQTLAKAPSTNETTGAIRGETVTPISVSFLCGDDGNLYGIMCGYSFPGVCDRNTVWTPEEMALADAHITALKSAIASTLPAPSLPLESSNAQN